MTTREQVAYWSMAIWVILATIVNIIGVIWFPPERVTFAIGMAGLLFCLLGPISFLIVALILGASDSMKRWPLWLNFIHPIFSFIIFTVINRDKIFKDKKTIPTTFNGGIN